MVAKFNSYYEQYISFHQFDQRALALEQQATYPLSHAHQQEYEKIDRLRIEGIKPAEKQCQQLRMGGVPYSDVMARFREELHAWSLVVRQKKGKKISSRHLKRIIKSSGIYVPANATLQDCEKLKREAFKRYKVDRKMAESTRETFYESLADAKAIANETKKATELRKLRTAEKQRAQARLSKAVRGKLRAGAASFVTVTDSTGRQRDVCDKQEIEQVFSDAHYAKYNQTTETPFMQAPLSQEFNFLGTGPAAQEVMNGSYQPTMDIDRCAELLLTQLEQTAAAKLSEPQARWLDTATWQKSWASGVRESTSSGPSAMHFGTLMAGAQSDLIAEFDATMTNIPLISGYSPSRWRQAIDTVLLKKQGLYLVEKLRTIVLFEPDFNWLNKLLGWTMMNFAENHGQLAPEQYGSRKYHKAIDQVV